MKISSFITRFVYASGAASAAGASVAGASATTSATGASAGVSATTSTAATSASLNYDASKDPADYLVATVDLTGLAFDAEGVRAFRLKSASIDVTKGIFLFSPSFFVLGFGEEPSDPLLN